MPMHPNFSIPQAPQMYMQPGMGVSSQMIHNMIGGMMFPGHGMQ